MQIGIYAVFTPEISLDNGVFDFHSADHRHIAPPLDRAHKIPFGAHIHIGKLSACPCQRREKQARGVDDSGKDRLGGYVVVGLGELVAPGMESVIHIFVDDYVFGKIVEVDEIGSGRFQYAVHITVHFLNPLGNICCNPQRCCFGTIRGYGYGYYDAYDNENTQREYHAENLVTEKSPFHTCKYS